jgi:hypothetical protein
LIYLGGLVTSGLPRAGAVSLMVSPPLRGDI